MYQYETHTAQKLIDLGLALMKEHDLAAKMWFYLQILRMYYESGQSGEDRIKFGRRTQGFADSLNDPAAFVWVGGKDAADEQLFGNMFFSYIDEKMLSKALDFAQARLNKVETQSGAQYSIHSAKVCQVLALIETGALDEAVKIGEHCERTLNEWMKSLPDEAKDSDQMLDHPELISKDLYWVLGKAYTAKGQPEL